ncbi:hypothetical protein OH76DRAFT_1422896 [Lentinus brumalis]|uniref:RanBD1 domain-containing protein n=1 Tax=Lentinus brumalis TaxID=2498619 RepID=A0A371CNB1_9APHY|nr:hypothetical protein OH76DRAFT_1422896 [Polyporus brumalis]
MAQQAASSAPPPSSTEAPESAPPSKFASFSGFGPSGGTSSFSFSSAPSQPPGAPKLTPAMAASSPFSFSGTPTSQPSSTFAPSISSSASAATKAFASIVSSSSTPPEPKAAPAADMEVDKSEVDYYKALRGLNVSFLSAVSKAIESDPFVDVAALLERYKTLRVSVSSDKSTSVPPASTSTPKTSEAPKPTPPPSFTMPPAPTSFVGFKPSAPSSSSAPAPASGGFVPKLDSGASPLGSPFSFAPSKPAASESSTTSEAPKSAFSFGSASSSGTSAPTSSFSFGAPSSSSGSSLFTKPGSSSSASSIFGSSASAFGSSSTPSFGGSSFGANDADKEKDKETDKDKPAGSLFGTGGSSTPFGTGSSTGATTPEKDKSASGTPFSFGSASPGKPSFFAGSSGGFGAPKAGSIGNPVGFGFGSPPRTTSDEPDNTNGPVKSLPFSFGSKPVFGSSSVFGSSAASASEKADTTEGETGTSAEGTPAPDTNGPLLSAMSEHDKEGEGEEDEETVHAIRSKVYKMTKDKEGNAQWGDMGVGVLRLKKHKETGVRRMLLRNSSTGKITINFLIHTGMNATMSDKVVSFIGHEEGASMPYRIRMKTPTQAKELKDALDREIEFVKSKTPDV